MISQGCPISFPTSPILHRSYLGKNTLPCGVGTAPEFSGPPRQSQPHVSLESSFTVVWQAHNGPHIFKVASAGVSMLLKPPTQSRWWTHPSLTKFPQRSLGNFIFPRCIPGNQWYAFCQCRVVCIFYILYQQNHTAHASLGLTHQQITIRQSILLWCVPTVHCFLLLRSDPP